MMNILFLNKTNKMIYKHLNQILFNKKINGKNFLQLVKLNKIITKL